MDEHHTQSHQHVDSEKESDSELSIDFGKMGGFFKKNYVWLLILIPIILSITFRMYPASLPMTDNWATGNIQNFIKQDISNLVTQNYPNLPVFNKNKLIEDEFVKSIKQDSYTIKTGQYKGQTVSISAEIAKSSASLKEFWQYDVNGEKFTYMPDIDPYTYLRYSRNLLETGQLGDEIKNGQQWDNHMVAPLGAGIGTTGHPYVLLWIYKLLSVFKPSMDLMAGATYFPVIFAALAVIPAFFLGRKFAGNVGGLFAAVMVAINPAFLSRTTWGHADTDAYVIFFALAITWLFLEAFEAKNTSWKFVFAAGAGALTGLFGYFWGGGWWYVFDFMLALAGMYFIYLLVIGWGKHPILANNALRDTALIAVTFVAATLLIGSLTVGFVRVAYAPLAPLGFMSIKEAAHISLWPNVYTTVAELNAVSMSQIVSAVGGKLFFLIALAGLAFALFKRDEHGKIDPKYFVLLAIWFVATLYASTKGVRFTMLIVPAFSLAFGTALGKIYEYANKWGEKGLHLSKKIIAPVVILIFVLLLLGSAKAWYASSINDIPIMNDAWWNSLTKINQESKPDAIINSWWDFGHHFKYVADRAVTFDGASQNTPMAHWVGKVLLTTNEKEAVGILRMLDCGSNTAFEELDKKINDVSKSVQIIYEVVVLDKDKAEALLEENNLSKVESENVLKYTHCSPPEDYFITSEDMIGKAGVWGHFGSWDFNRADAWTMRNAPKAQFIEELTKASAYSARDAEKLYEEVQGITTEDEANSWIAAWPNYASGISDCVQQGTSMQCGGISIDSKAKNVTIQTQQGAIKPVSFVYFDGKDVVEKEFKDGTGGISVAMMPVQGGYNAILVQKPIAMSMFNRLYFFLGEGLSCFKPFDAQRQLTGGMIYTWKIDWDCKEKNNVFLEQNSTQEIPKAVEETVTEELAILNSSENTSGVLVE